MSAGAKAAAVVATVAAALLVVSIVGFALGLAALTGLRLTLGLAALGAALAVISTVLIAATLISPPDYIEISNELAGDAGGFDIDYDVPFGREAGGFIALVASLGVLAGAVLTLREQRR